MFSFSLLSNVIIKILFHPLVLGYMNGEERDVWKLDDERLGADDPQNYKPIYSNIPEVVKAAMTYGIDARNSDTVKFGIYLEGNVTDLDLQNPKMPPKSESHAQAAIIEYDQDPDLNIKRLTFYLWCATTLPDDVRDSSRDASDTSAPLLDAATIKTSLLKWMISWFYYLGCVSRGEKLPVANDVQEYQKQVEIEFVNAIKQSPVNVAPIPPADHFFDLVDNITTTMHGTIRRPLHPSPTVKFGYLNPAPTPGTPRDLCANILGYHAVPRMLRVLVSGGTNLQQEFLPHNAKKYMNTIDRLLNVQIQKHSNWVYNVEEVLKTLPTDRAICKKLIESGSVKVSHTANLKRSPYVYLFFLSPSRLERRIPNAASLEASVLQKITQSKHNVIPRYYFDMLAPDAKPSIPHESVEIARSPAFRTPFTVRVFWKCGGKAVDSQQCRKETFEFLTSLVLNNTSCAAPAGPVTASKRTRNWNPVGNLAVGSRAVQVF